MTHDPWRMHRLTMRFADPAAEAAFAEDQARKAVRPVRIALAAFAALSFAFYLALVHVFPGVFVGIDPGYFLSYTVAAAAMCLLVHALTHRPVFLQHQQLVMGLLACVLWIGIVRASGRAPAPVVEARGYTIALLFTFFVYGALRLRIAWATAAGWWGGALYVFSLAASGLGSNAAIGRSAVLLAGANLGGMLICWQIEAAARREFSSMRLLVAERERSERLLLNILPGSIAERLKATDAAIAEHADGVTVLFGDIVGFTPLSARKTPHELVALLNRVFTGFDAIADAHGLEKIKTVGDAYMAVAGLPVPKADHAGAAASAALAMQACIAELATETGEPLVLRIGLHSGPVVAGVIGTRKFAYDLWGDTVNTASRMESHALPGGVQCSAATAALLGRGFRLEARGVQDIKGKGPMETFLVLGPVPAGDAPATPDATACEA